MKKKPLKLVAGLAALSLLLGTLLAFPAAADAPAKSNTPENSESETSASTSAARTKEGKEEVVYANLSSNGNVNDIYVVNEFEVQTSGTLKDYGDYTSVSNLTTTQPLTQQGNTVEATVESGSFFYQGDMAGKDLPWLFEVSYFLNSKKVDPSELAGQSGKLEIQVKTRENRAVNSVFYKNYMLQISMNLDTALCSNIVSENATIANAGKQKVINHTVMPGKDANIRVTADVTEFSMGSIEVAALPFSMPIEIPNTDEMTGEMSGLTGAISALNDGVGELSTGAAELSSGVAQLTDGSSEFMDGLSLLSSNSAKLIDGSSQIDQALAEIKSKLGGSEAMDISELSQLPGILSSLSGGLEKVSGSLTQLRDGFSASYAALDGAIAAIPTDPIDLNILSALVNSGTDEEIALNQLIANYQAAQTVRGTYYGPSGTGTDGTKAGFEAVVNAINALTDPTSQQSINGIAGALSTMSSEMTALLGDIDLDGLQQLSDGLATFSSRYEEFHSGLLEYTGGIATAAAGYGELHSGLAALSDGTGQLASGTAQLHDGTGELNGAVSELPDAMQQEIDNLLEDYDKSNFEPVSFTSSKNKDVANVQFVLMTESIVIDDTPDETVEEEADLTAWDRFLALFNPKTEE